jgi:peptide/nickel transport system substrate-binding protein
MRRVACLALLVLLVGCQGSTPSPVPKATPPASHYHAEPPSHKGGTLVLGDWELPGPLNPLTAATENELRIAALMFSPLWGLDGDLLPYPDLVAEVPTVENGDVKANADGSSMTVSIKLLPGLRWSDGQALTSDDVIFTWQAITGPELAVRAGAGWSKVTAMDRRSDTELTWRFGGLYPAYLSMGAGGRLLPKHRLESIPREKWAADPYFSKPDVVSGPFIYKDAVGEQLITLVANPHYADGRSHAPYLDQVVYRTYGGKPSLLEGLKAGETDVGFHLLPDDLPLLKTFAGSASLAGPGLQTEFLSPNHDLNTATGRAPPWKDDPRLLEGLSLAIDRDALAAEVFGGAARVTPGVFPAAMAAFADPTLAPPKRDLEGARRILDTDGWKAGADGIRTRAGRRLEFALATVCGGGIRPKEADLLVKQWQEAGAAVTTACVDRARFFGTYQAHGVNAYGAFDMSLYSNGWGGDPSAWAIFAAADQVPGTERPGGQNWGRCRDSTLDAQFQAGASSLDYSHRRAAYLAAQREWLAYHCTIPLLDWPRVIQKAAKVHNFSPNPTLSTDVWNAADWWTDG